MLGKLVAMEERHREGLRDVEKASKGGAEAVIK